MFVKKLNYQEKKLAISVLLGELFLFISLPVWRMCVKANVKSVVVQVMVMALLFFTASLVNFNSKIIDKYYKIGYFKFSFIKQVKKQILVSIIAFILLALFISLILNSEISKVSNYNIPKGILKIWFTFIYCYFHFVNCAGVMRAYERKNKNYL